MLLEQQLQLFQTSRAITIQAHLIYTWKDAFPSHHLPSNSDNTVLSSSIFPHFIYSDFRTNAAKEIQRNSQELKFLFLLNELQHITKSLVLITYTILHHSCITQRDSSCSRLLWTCSKGSNHHHDHNTFTLLFLTLFKQTTSSHTTGQPITDHTRDEYYESIP